MYRSRSASGYECGGGSVWGWYGGGGGGSGVDSFLIGSQWGIQDFDKGGPPKKSVWVWVWGWGVCVGGGGVVCVVCGVGV